MIEYGGNMICPKCNTKNPEGNLKCSECGAILPERDEFDSGPGTMSGIKTAMEPKDIESRLKKGSLFAGRYEILNDGFKGGMGIVFKVKDNMLGDIKALKLILPAYLENEKAVSRFKQEVATTQKLLHENIVRVYDIGESEGMLYFTMEWIDGISMRDYISERKKENNKLSFEEVKYIIGQVCFALSYAHKNFQITHRDIKPENLLMIDPYTKSPKIKIADFGIAKTESQTIHHSVSAYMGTPIYMAPEQYTDAAHVDKKADIYSVGVILYELLTFMHPLGTFPMPSEVNPLLPKKIDEIIKKALSADKTKRYEDAAEIVNALDASVEREKPDAQQTGTNQPISKVGQQYQTVKEEKDKEEKKSMLIPAIIVVVVLMLAGIGFMFFKGKVTVDGGVGVTQTAPGVKTGDRPDIDKLLSEGETLYKQGKYPECIEKMKEVLQTDNRNSKAQFYMRQADNKLENIRKLSDPSSSRGRRY
jgi:serine/threonine-protein kinase